MPIRNVKLAESCSLLTMKQEVFNAIGYDG